MGNQPHSQQDSGHQQQGHQHRDLITLPDGRTVVGSTHPNGGYPADGQPDFGLYLDPIWQPPWPHRHLDWPDFGLPADQVALLDALHDLLTRVDAGQVVEIGCIGGHGRTGTAVGCLVTLIGGAGDPVEWVRQVYCPQAIETDEQAAMVRRLATDR